MRECLWSDKDCQVIQLQRAFCAERPCKLQTCADLDLFYLVLVETDQVNLTQPPIPKQLREYGKQNRVPVIIDFIYDSSLSRQIIVDSPNIGGD